MSRLLQVPEGTIPVAYIETLHMLPDGSPRRFRRPLLWPYSKFPHALIVGGTGSGKTSFFKVMLSSFIRYEPEAELYLCSYKTRMEDFAFLETGSHFGDFRSCRDIFEAFFQRFTDRLEGRDKKRTPLILGFDEWGGFLLSLPKKEQEDVLAKMGQLLMLGRSIGVFVLCALQRPDAVFFRNGARDNFGLVVAMGNLSSDGFQMVFPSDFLSALKPCRQIGEGHALIGGFQFSAIRGVSPKACTDRNLAATFRRQERDDGGTAL